MAHDRLPDDDVPVTHELIADMLGVRRAGVTEAVDRLRIMKLIKPQRGSIRLHDRKGLQQVAGLFYGHPEQEYLRLVRSR
jgi:Mn-dependent DtxR family transcriptional regulator